MLAILASFLLLAATNTRVESSRIIFPKGFVSSKYEKLNPLEVKKSCQKGIDTVQSVAGLVQDLLLQETINFASKNWVISPVSLATVFSQLLMGSRGEIQDILNGALSLGGDEDNYQKFEVHRQLGNLLRYLDHPGNDDYTLLMNGIVFFQSGFSIRPTYKYALLDFYNTKIIPVDFAGQSPESLKKINDWTWNATRGTFSELVPALSPNTICIMANVVYFKGSWELPFDPSYTQPGPFFIDQTRKVQVDYMYGEQEILYGTTSDYQLIGLPFKSREVVIYILLPNGRFSTRLAMKQLDVIASSARLRNVTLVLPKFKLTTSISVKDAIGKYLRKKPGRSRRLHAKSKNFTRLNVLERYAQHPLPLRISNPANHFDMSGVSDNISFNIDDIIHKVSIQVDEKGTEIVALTSTLIDHSGSEWVQKVNRPFLFFVRHEVTLTHLFWGLVVDPSKS